MAYRLKDQVKDLVDVVNRTNKRIKAALEVLDEIENFARDNEVDDNGNVIDPKMSKIAQLAAKARRELK